MVASQMTCCLQKARGPRKNTAHAPWTSLQRDEVGSPITLLVSELGENVCSMLNRRVCSQSSPNAASLLCNFH